MRYHLLLHYGWFLQNLEKGCIRTNMHTTVSILLQFVSAFLCSKALYFFKKLIFNLILLDKIGSNQINLYKIYSRFCLWLQIILFRSGVDWYKFWSLVLILSHVKLVNMIYLVWILRYLDPHACPTFYFYAFKIFDELVNFTRVWNQDCRDCRYSSAL